MNQKIISILCLFTVFFFNFVTVESDNEYQSE